MLKLAWYLNDKEKELHAYQKISMQHFYEGNL
jgi:hypothetical protein